MLKKILHRFVTNLGEMEGDYRAFYLKDDIAYSTLYISIAVLGVLGIMGMDALLAGGQPYVFTWVLAYRAGFVVVSTLVMVALWKTSKVRVYDRMVFGWLAFTILFFLLLNFTRPNDSLTTIIDVM